MPEPTPLNDKEQAVLDHMTAYKQQSDAFVRTAAQSHHLNMASKASMVAGAAASFRTLFLGLKRRPVGRSLGVSAAMAAVAAGASLAERELDKRGCLAYGQAKQQKQAAIDIVQSVPRSYWQYLSLHERNQPKAVMAQLVADETKVASKACQLASGGVLLTSALSALMGKNPGLSLRGGGVGLVLLAANKGLQAIREEHQRQADKYARMADHQFNEATDIMMERVAP